MVEKKRIKIDFYYKLFTLNLNYFRFVDYLSLTHIILKREKNERTTQCSEISQEFYQMI